MSTNYPLLLRRTGLAATAVTGYATAVYFSLQFFSPLDDGKQTSKELHSNSSSCNCYTTSPDRIETFQNIAQVYDDQISRDEFVMGLPLLRRSLLYFNAQGMYICLSFACVLCILRQLCFDFHPHLRLFFFEGSVLEVGAGTGRNLNYYPKKYVKNVVLTDTSDKMLLQARDKIIEMRKKKSNSFLFGKDKEDDLFKIFVADATNMTKYYQEDTFDTIVSTFTLCSFDDPVEVLRELQSVCKDDGKILLLEHGRSKSFNGLSNYLDKYAERHAKNWGCVWNRDLDDILDKAGLEIDKVHTWHFGTTYYVVCRPSLKVKEQRRRMREEMKLKKSHVHEENHDSKKGLIPWSKFFSFHFGKKMFR